MKNAEKSIVYYDKMLSFRILVFAHFAKIFVNLYLRRLHRADYPEFADF